MGCKSGPSADQNASAETDITEAPRNSNNHIGEKYINVRAGKSLTPPKLERNVVLSLQSISRF